MSGGIRYKPLPDGTASLQSSAAPAVDATCRQRPSRREVPQSVARGRRENECSRARDDELSHFTNAVVASVLLAIRVHGTGILLLLNSVAEQPFDIDCFHDCSFSWHYIRLLVNWI